MAKSSGVVSEGSFHIEQEVRIAAPREQVFRSLCDVQSWWCHHFAPRNPRITLDARVGGEFREHWGDGEGALWGTVIYIKSPEALRLSGPLGMNTPVSSVYEFRLDEDGKGTIVRLSHRAVGLIDSKWKESHSDGWNQLLTRLAVFAERGEKYAG